MNRVWSIRARAKAAIVERATGLFCLLTIIFYGRVCMTYANVHQGIFLSRPNRFIAEIEINGKKEICHVKNTGRCKELLVPGAAVYANQADNPNRCTKFDLIAVEKGDSLINIDSYAPNIVFGEYIRQGKFLHNVTNLKAEAKYRASRLDYYIETTSNKAFIEVKGVTLEENGIAMFPDAPTERGIKHLNELAACVAAGYDAHVVFVIQMAGIIHFAPNYKTHAAFGKALAKAMALGVKATAFDCKVTPDSMAINKQIPINIDNEYMKEGLSYHTNPPKQHDTALSTK
jgi:sugar fermentation stimulation protein A